MWVCSPECESCHVKEVFKTAEQSKEYFHYPLSDTVTCTNKMPLPDLTECAGFCDSATIYSDVMTGFDNDCHCCQPITTSTQVVELTCTDGQKINQPYDLPTKCGCGSCSAAAKKRKR